MYPKSSSRFCVEKFYLMTIRDAEIWNNHVFIYSQSVTSNLHKVSETLASSIHSHRMESFVPVLQSPQGCLCSCHGDSILAWISWTRTNWNKRSAAYRGRTTDRVSHEPNWCTRSVVIAWGLDRLTQSWWWLWSKPIHRLTVHLPTVKKEVGDRVGVLFLWWRNTRLKRVT